MRESDYWHYSKGIHSTIVSLAKTASCFRVVYYYVLLKDDREMGCSNRDIRRQREQVLIDIRKLQERLDCVKTSKPQLMRQLADLHDELAILDQESRNRLIIF